MKNRFICFVGVLSLYSFLMVMSSCTDQSSSKLKESNPITVSPILDSLDMDLQEFYDTEHLPGFALSIFTKDSVFFSKGYGFADMENRKKYQTNTVQGIASVSKTLIAVSLMKAVEAQAINLDTEINDILPFKVINPDHKESAITIRHLATHTSSISDDGHYDNAYVFSQPLDKSDFPDAWHGYLDVYNENTWMEMEEFLIEIFSTSRKSVGDENYLSKEPGTYYEYSNIGSALLAYCIQLSVGEKYNHYTSEIILNELGMNRSAWSRDEVDTINHITYYNEIYNEVPSYQCITYPDGNLFSTVDDLTKFMQEMMKGYYGKGQVLTHQSYLEMMKNQIPHLDTPTGLIWDLDNDCCIGHGGNDFGTATMMYFNPQNGIGKILFTNISIEKEEQEETYYGIFNNMFKYDSEIETAILK